MGYDTMINTDKIPAQCDGVSERRNLSMARRRFQRGQLLRSGDNWLGRWREDVANDAGAVQRVHKKEVIGTLADFPTRRLALRELERRLDEYENGGKLSVVAFRTKKAWYWVSNTLEDFLPNSQMLAIAASMTPAG